MIPASVLNALPAQQAAAVTSRAFFPQLILTAFHHGLVEVLIFAIIMCSSVRPPHGFGVVNTSITKRASPESRLLIQMI